MLREVSKFRAQKSALYAPPNEKVNKYEYVPWTAASGAGGIRDSLLHIIASTWQHGVRATGEPELQQRHYKNLVELVDFVLDGRRAYLESIKSQDKYAGLLQKYESQRSALIFAFGKSENDISWKVILIKLGWCCSRCRAVRACRQIGGEISRFSNSCGHLRSHEEPSSPRRVH